MIVEDKYKWIHDFIEQHDRQTSGWPEWVLRSCDAPVESDDGPRRPTRSQRVAIAMGTDPEFCIVRPHIGQPRCKAHHEESWWYNNKRCDKPQGHKGKHVTFQRTLYGLDENRFSVWDENGYSAHYAKEA